MSLKHRITSIDLLRGIVMIVMALDHTRDFFHIEAFTGNALDLQTASPQLFLTRWITHFCAPVFVFLSGTSAYLQSLRKPRKELSSFLLSRGIWLILLELTVVTLGISFDITFNFFVLQVIWAIGISMVILSQLIRLPFSVILATGIIIVGGHNLLDFYESSRTDFPAWYTILHRQDTLRLTSDHLLLVFYPFLPWTGVMILGYCFGRFYSSHVENRNKRTFYLGAALTVLFVVLRWWDVYGDPLHWSPQKSPLYTIFSFINTQKYPPSLLYLCMTIGPSLILLGLFGQTKNKLSEMISVYGRVPLFYYIIHFYLIHTVSAVFFLLRGHSFEEGMSGLQGSPFRFVAAGEGYDLGIVYLVWICIVIALYPVCRWYANYKFRNNRSWWLSYL